MIGREDAEQKFSERPGVGLIVARTLRGCAVSSRTLNVTNPVMALSRMFNKTASAVSMYFVCHFTFENAP